MEPINARAPPELIEEIEDWADEMGYARSKAVRLLLKRAMRDHSKVRDLEARINDLEGVEEHVDELEQRVEAVEDRPFWRAL